MWPRSNASSSSSRRRGNTDGRRSSISASIAVDVVFKDIKNVHLSVYPPTGRVRISAPARMKLDTIRVFAISKLGWIKRQQKKLREQERETPREYLDRESHYLWGKRYLLQVLEMDAAPEVQLDHWQDAPAGASAEQVKIRSRPLLPNFIENRSKRRFLPLLARWAPVMGVTVDRFYVQQMKTKWGSCNPRARTIRLNTELAKKPKQCLEYIVVHEMVHFFERHHGDRFICPHGQVHAAMAASQGWT